MNRLGPFDLLLLIVGETSSLYDLSTPSNFTETGPRGIIPKGSLCLNHFDFTVSTVMYVHHHDSKTTFDILFQGISFQLKVL